MKKIYKIRDGKTFVEEKECHPQRLPTSFDYVYKYWADALRSVLNYQKERGLVEIHKLVTDDRILKGWRLYRNHHIKMANITTNDGGDVYAQVLSEDKQKEYSIVIKNFLPEELPQYNYERERYISNLIVYCTCPDHTFTRYRSNASMLCGHINAVFFHLIEHFNMPKIFIFPEEKIVGIKKSDVEEIEVNIKALPLLKYSYYINLLLLKKYRGMKPALGVSVHKVLNPPYGEGEVGKPIWLTYTRDEDVLRLIRGLQRVYSHMRGKRSLLKRFFGWITHGD